MPDNLDDKMNQIDIELTFLQMQMENLSQQFIQETVTFTSDWYQKTAEPWLRYRSRVHAAER